MRAREQWSYQSHLDWNEGEITVTVHDDGKVLVAVQEEQAVDSYNSYFTCSALLPAEQVRQLAELFARAAGTKNERENLAPRGENYEGDRR